MIFVTDFTYEYVTPIVVERIIEKMKETGDTQIDFKGTSILRHTHKSVAELVVLHGADLFNIENMKDREIVEYHIDQLEDPRVDNINDYIKILKKRFKKGEVCILNEKKYIGRRDNGYKRSLILIENYIDRGILIRKYYASKVQPKYFKEAGGKDSPSLYTITELGYTDLFNGLIRLEHPKTQLERDVIDILFKV